MPFGEFLLYHIACNVLLGVTLAFLKVTFK